MPIVRHVLISAAMLLGVAGSPAAAQAEELTPDKQARIERLLEMTGALSLGRQMSSMVVQQITDVLRTSRPDIPQRALAALPSIIDDLIGERLPALRDLLVPLYHRHFTAAEITSLIDFYGTEVGRKTIRVMPQLLQESMALGQKWGESLGPEIQRRVRARLDQEGVKL